MKIVLDANLFASALIKPNSNPGKILDLVKQNQVELILSPAVMKEIKRILLYPKIQKYHCKTAEEIDAYFEDILMFAWIVEGNETVELIKDDPADNKYLACAFEGEADYIISGDHHLLDIENYRGIEIIQAQAFLNDIPSINIGGCGISALSLYRWLKKENELKDVKFVYLYDDKNDYLNNKRVLRSVSFSSNHSLLCAIFIDFKWL